MYLQYVHHMHQGMYVQREEISILEQVADATENLQSIIHNMQYLQNTVYA